MRIIAFNYCTIFEMEITIHILYERGIVSTD